MKDDNGRKSKRGRLLNDETDGMGMDPDGDCNGSVEESDIVDTSGRSGGRRKIRRRYTRKRAFFHGLKFRAKLTVGKVYPRSRRWKMMRPKDPICDDYEDVFEDIGVKESSRHRFRRTLMAVVPGGKKRNGEFPRPKKKKRYEEYEELMEGELKESLRFRVKRKMKKLAVWAVVGLALVITFSVFKEDIIDLLSRNAVTWAIYTHISGHLSNNTLLGLAYAGFFGALFFIMIPLEAVFFYYIALDYNPWVVLAVMQVSSVTGLTADYLMGAMVGERTLLRFAAETFKKTENAMENWGGIIVLVSNVIPFLPIQVVSLGIGSTRFGLVRFIVLTFIGRLIYLMGLLYFADFFRAIFG